MNIACFAVRAGRIGVTCGAMLLSWGCGSAGSGTATSPSPSIVIQGPATLVVGQTLQYTASTTSGQDVTIRSDWTTSDSRTATTTHSGLVTAIATGTVTLFASYQASHASITLVVESSVLSPEIAACGLITAPGIYVVDRDISQPAAAGDCLTITSGGVRLDCRNHTVSGVFVSGASDVSVSNCTAGPAITSAIRANDSSNVTIDHDTASTIELLRGHDNSIVDSMIDGGYDGHGGMNGRDDGIVLGDQTNDRIDGNTIQNVWDAGIEGLDAVTNTAISHNTIVNTGAAAITSYWCTEWTGDAVTGNTASRGANLVFFNYQTGTKCLDRSTPGAFANNRLTGNTFRDPIPGGAPGAMYFDFGNLPVSAISNNLIQGNDLGAAPGPYTVPASGFVNGGANICTPPQNPFCGG